jgi:hypothetical protein
LNRFAVHSFFFIYSRLSPIPNLSLLYILEIC